MTARQPLVILTGAEIPPLREAMRELQWCVADYYAESARAGDLGPRVRRFLVAGQTLNDLLSNEIAASDSYKSLFSTPRHYAADLIEGVKFARNVTQHLLHILRPSDDVVLVGGSLGMRQYAVWDQIPPNVVSQLQARTQRLEPAYTANLEGHEVTGTMMSVLRFYAEVNPSIVHRDSRSEWSGFPLLSQPGVNTPLHPEEPTDLAQSILWMNSRPPGGDCRVVCGQVTIGGTSYVFGHTFIGALSFAPFVETVGQVAFDLGLGYRYLEGDIASSIDDVTGRFPNARQGSVLESRGEVLSWATPILSIDDRDDWLAPQVDIESWTTVVEMEADTRMPASFMFGPRRARRLNALVPPS